MERLLVLFQTTHAVIKAERLCITRNIPCKVIAVPRMISSECGISIELRSEQETAVRKLLTENNVLFELHRMK